MVGVPFELRNLGMAAGSFSGKIDRAQEVRANGVVCISMRMLVYLMCLAGVGLASGKWAPMHEAGLIKHSTDIVVADFQSMEAEKNDQKAGFKVVETWKGEAKGVIQLSGTSHKICAPVVDFTNWKKGRYLLFVKKDGELYNPFNGHFSVLLISDGKVPWFVENEGLITRKPAGLAEVKAKVAKKVAAEKAEFQKGAAKAKEELAKGVIRYEIVGQPRLTDLKLKKLAKEKLGIEVVLLGCMGSPNVKFHEGHQNVVKAHLLKKHGHDPVLKLEKTLR